MGLLGDISGAIFGGGGNQSTNSQQSSSQSAGPISTTTGSYNSESNETAPALGEGRAVATALASLAQQPDASATITRTLFVGLAMIESTAIYCFVVSMILIFANPFWNHVISAATGK